MINNDSITAYVDKLFKGSKLPVKLRKSILLFLFTSMKAFTLVPAFVGRMIDEKSQRRGIKRNFNLFKNKFLTLDMMQKVYLAMFKNLIKDLKKIILVIDWSEIRQFNFFSVSLVIGERRTIPIIFSGYEYNNQKLGESQPEIEKRTLQIIREAIASDVFVIVTADRGFDAPETIKYVKNLGFSYVFRVSTGNYFYTKKGKEKKITHNLVKKGGEKAYKNIEYTKKERVESNLYCKWSWEQKEPWLILSDLDEKIEKIMQIYFLRMGIEEMFKSLKNEYTGFDIKQVRIRYFDRWLKFLFISTIVFHLLGIIGSSLHKIKRIEQLFSLSSKSPKKQNFIFSMYSIAVHAIRHILIQIKIIGRRVFVQLPDSGVLCIPINEGIC